VDLVDPPFLTVNDKVGGYKCRDLDKAPVRGMAKRGRKPGPAARRLSVYKNWKWNSKYLCLLGYLPVYFVEQLCARGESSGMEMAREIRFELECYCIEAVRRRNLAFGVWSKSQRELVLRHEAGNTAIT
jgi:hypothetical protein